MKDIVTVLTGKKSILACKHELGVQGDSVSLNTEDPVGPKAKFTETRISEKFEA